MSDANRTAPREAVSVPSYSVPRAAQLIDLRLDSNEGPPPEPELLEALSAVVPGEALRRYPSARDLERALAGRFGVEPERVLVTAGGDDALLRIALAALEPGRELIFPEPSFEMIPRYARLAGAEVKRVPETEERYPIRGVLRALSESSRPGVVAVVSPNNPTGSVASVDDLRRISEAARGRLVLCDCAYAEFAEQDLTETALGLDNAVCVRTFSKAWGLAGLRVGWVMGPKTWIDALRAGGNPYGVAGPSLALALRALELDGPNLQERVERVCGERERLVDRLRWLGAKPRQGQGNFVLADFGDARAVRDGLARQGIGVRLFPDQAGLERALRITCPGDPVDERRLVAALSRVASEVEGFAPAKGVAS